MTSLLRKIQDQAVDPSFGITALLRLCKILAARVDSQPLRSWANSELNGYSPKSELPDYRVFSAMCHMQIRNAIAGVQTIQVPSTAIETAVSTEMAEEVTTIHCRQSIAELEDLHAGAERTGGQLKSAWPQELTYLVGKHLTRWEPLAAWTDISASRINGILDIVRTRVLDLALDLEKEDPALAEHKLGESTPIEPERIDQIVNIHVTGNYANVHAPVSQISVSPGDIDALRAALKKLGLSDAEVESSALVVQEEKSPEGVIKRLRDTGGKLLTKAGETTIAELVKDFLAGLG